MPKCRKKSLTEINNELTTISRFILEKRKVQAQEFLSGHSLLNLNIETQEDIVLDGLLVKLKTEILAETEPKELYVACFKMHQSWWQWFKDEIMPKGFKKLFPVKFILVKKYLTIHREAWYPKLNRVFPESGNPIIKEFIEEKEIRNY